MLEATPSDTSLVMLVLARVKVLFCCFWSLCSWVVTSRGLLCVITALSLISRGDLVDRCPSLSQETDRKIHSCMVIGSPSLWWEVGDCATSCPKQIYERTNTY